jgi:hypothetical protein
MEESNYFTEAAGSHYLNGAVDSDKFTGSLEEMVPIIDWSR